MPGSQRLDATAVLEHVRALAQRATQIAASIQRADATFEPTGEPLDQLARRLVAGEIVGLQLRFFLDDAWCRDTLLRAPESFRLVRVREGN
ncbi:MAG: hypothetical protein JO257_09025 [Deltaproteobacteria bacterium]|nr:hypothetical protein [Deltaproteobacteria bacterium]